MARVKYNSKTQMPISNIAEMLELPILGVIPEDERVQQSLVMKDALVHTFPKSRPALAYKRIAARMEGIQYDGRPSFFDRLFGKY